MGTETNHDSYSHLEIKADRQQELGVSLFVSEHSSRLFVKAYRQINTELLMQLLLEIGVQERFVKSDALEELGLSDSPDPNEYVLLAEAFKPAEIISDVDFQIRQEEINGYLKSTLSSDNIPKEPFISIPAGTLIAVRKTEEQIALLDNPVDIFGVAAKHKASVFKFKTGNGLKEDSKGRIIAEVGGLLTFTGGTLNIQDTFSIKSLEDWFDGNLDFDGNVEVGHDMMENFDIRAGGNITLRGCSDSTNLRAGGDITVAEGIIGQEDVVVEAGGSIKARYINQAQVVCNGDCELNRGIFHSKVLCYGRIIMPAGVIVGGVVYAAEGMEAREVGGVSEVKTVVMAGLNKGAPLSPDSIQVQLKNIDDEVARIGMLVKPLLQSGQGQTEEVRKYIEELQQLKKLQQELFDWTDSHDEEDCLNAMVVVRSTIHLGSTVIINNSRMDVMQTMTRVIFRYSPEKMEVVAEPLR